MIEIRAAFLIPFHFAHHVHLMAIFSLICLLVQTFQTINQTASFSSHQGGSENTCACTNCCTFFPLVVPRLLRNETLAGMSAFSES